MPAKYIRLSIAILGTIWAFLIHTHNVSFLNSIQSPKVNKGMIITADDASYLTPAENLIRKGSWKDNSVGVSAFIQRPPGMGLLHLLAFSISPDNFSVIHKCLHVLIHFIGLILFGIIVGHFCTNRWAFVIQLIYTILPCFWGYMFYYITESITPVLLLAIFWGFLEFKKNPSSRWLLVQAVFSGLLLLFRPQLFIFILPVLYNGWFYLKKWGRSNVHVLFMAFMLMFGGYLLWQMRAMAIVGHWPGMHPIYHHSNQSPYRPVHQSFGQMYKVWEHNSERFHKHMLIIWDHHQHDSVSVRDDISHILSEIPDKIRNAIGEDELTQVFYEFHLISADVHSGMYQSESSREQALRQRINKHTSALKSTFWMDNYLITPFHSASFLLSKSQLNLDVFQQAWRGRWWMECLRGIALMLILLSLIGTVWGIIRWRNDLYILFGSSILVYLGYLFFIQKMNEERYLFPLLPIIFLMACLSMMSKRNISGKA